MSQQQNPTVLVVEDESLLLRAITTKLKLNEVAPLPAASAAQAFDYLSNMKDAPNAIWLDYHLSDMDGLAFMARVKENPKWAHIPVFIVSNSASPDKVNSMLALGAKKYLVKAEHRLDELVTTIIDYIKTK